MSRTRIDEKILADIEAAITFIINHKDRLFLDDLIRLPNESGSEYNQKLFNVKETLYNFYTFNPAFKKIFKDILNFGVQEQWIEFLEKFKQRYMHAIQSAKQIITTTVTAFPKDIYYTDSGKYWLWVRTHHQVGTIARRVYINCEPEVIPVIVHELLKLMTGTGMWNKPAPVWFKLHSPGWVNYLENKYEHPIHAVNLRRDINSGLSRCERIVVYYKDDPAIHEIFRDFAGTLMHYSKGMPVPRFTTIERDGFSFAKEPFPDKEDAPSFGDVLCINVTKAVFSHIIRNKRVYISPAEKTAISKELLRKLKESNFI